MRKNFTIPLTALLIGSSFAIGMTTLTRQGGGGGGDAGFTSDFRLLHADLVPNGRNAYFSLVPGRVLRLEGEDDGALVVVEITVTDQIRLIPLEIDGEDIVVRCRVIREREWEDGELVEISRNFFSRDARTGNIYYFGEEVDIFEDGKIVSHDGAWLAGVDGAQPGLIMPSLHLVGARYFQEIAPGVAMDKAKHVEGGIEYTTPAGTFTDCIMILESSPLEPGHFSTKIYAPGVGLLVDSDAELVEFHN